MGGVARGVRGLGRRQGFLVSTGLAAAYALATGSTVVIGGDPRFVPVLPLRPLWHESRRRSLHLSLALCRPHSPPLHPPSNGLSMTPLRSLMTPLT